MERGWLFYDLLPAALQNLSPELKRPLVLKGRRDGIFFWRVVFPLLMPTTLFVLINAVLNSFKLVDHLFVLKKGAPTTPVTCCCTTSTRMRFRTLTRIHVATLTVVLLFPRADVTRSILSFG